MSEFKKKYEGAILLKQKQWGVALAEKNIKQVTYKGFKGKSYFDDETKHWYCEFEGKTPKGDKYSNTVVGSSESEVQRKFVDDVKDLN